MEVYYDTFFEEGVKPSLNKVVRLGTESVPTAIGVENTHELDLVDPEIIQTHMENMLLYLKHLVSQTTMVELGILPTEGLPIIGWVNVMKLADEINRWWIYLYYKDENPQVLPQ